MNNFLLFLITTSKRVALIALLLTTQSQAVVFLTHGFNAKHEQWYQPGGDFYEALKNTAAQNGHTIKHFGWDQSQSYGFFAEEQKRAGLTLAKIIFNFCINYSHNPEYPNDHEIIIVAHSYGGLVSYYCTMALENLLEQIETKSEFSSPSFNEFGSIFSGIVSAWKKNSIKPHISKLFTLGTPHLETDPLPSNFVIDNIYNIYSPADLVAGGIVGSPLLPITLQNNHSKAYIITLLVEIANKKIQGLNHEEIHHPEVARHLFKIAAEVDDKKNHLTYIVSIPTLKPLVNAISTQQSTVKNILLDKEIEDSIGTVSHIKIAYMLHNIAQYSIRPRYRSSIADESIKDLDLFLKNKNTAEKSAFAHFNKTETLSGRIALQSILARPTFDIATLKKRQDFVQLLLKNPRLHKKLVKTLKKITENESEFLCIAGSMKIDVERYYRDILFDLPKINSLNSNPTFMHAATYLLAGRELATLISLDTLLLMVFATEGNFNVNRMLNLFGINSNFYSICSIIGINSLLFITATNQLISRLPIIKKLKKTMHSVASVLISTHKELVTTLADYDAATAILPELEENSFSQISTQKSKQLLTVLNDLENEQLEAGYAAAAFVRKKEIKDNFADSYKLLGFIDAFVSIATLIKESKKDHNQNYCFVDFVNAPSPLIIIKELWTTNLNTQFPKTLDVSIDNLTLKSNTITSSHNIGMTVLIAQSLGIIPATHATLTPFCNFINDTNKPTKNHHLLAEENSFSLVIRNAGTNTAID